MLLLFALILVASVIFRSSLPGTRPSKDLVFSDLQTKLAAKTVKSITIIGNDAQTELNNDQTIYNTKLPERWEQLTQFNALLTPAPDAPGGPKAYRPTVEIRTPAFSGPLMQLRSGSSFCARARPAPARRLVSARAGPAASPTRSRR